MSKAKNQVTDEEASQEEEEEEEVEKCSELQMNLLIEKIGSLVDECSTDDILDISTFNVDDEQTWLIQNSLSDLGYDLNIWLRTGMCKNSKPSIENDNNNGLSASSINTRTFTRGKKKLGKLHFDEVNRANDVDNKIEINWKEEAMRSKDCIPAMLKQSLPGVVSCGEESLEAFLNMSHSKGIDSFINMAEPDLTDSFMNVSRSALFHVNTANTVVENVELGCMADSQILTESMMQTSIFNDMDDTIRQNFNKTLPDGSNQNLIQPEVLQCDDDDDDDGVMKQAIDHFDLLDKTFDKSPFDNPYLSYTITVEDNNVLVKGTEANEPKILNSTFDTDCSFTKISLNSTFKACEMDEYRRNRGIIEKKTDEMASNFTYITDEKIVDSSILDKKDTMLHETLVLNCDEQELLDTTYSKKDDIEKTYSNDDLPINRYQTYRKIGKNNKMYCISETSRNKMTLDGDRNNQVKSMENLHRMNQTKDLQEMYPGKLNGAKSLSRLPPPIRQKSNPNLPSHLPTVVKNRKIPKNGTFDGNAERVKLNKNTISTGGKKCNFNQDKVVSLDYDKNCEVDSKSNLFLSNKMINEACHRHGEEFNLQSTPNSGRKILENTWVTSEKDLPSPILKNDNINGKQADSGVQTSSPLISPAESLQSVTVCEMNEAKCPMSVAKSTNKTDAARLPTSRSTSGIPRPTSRIPAPKISRTNAQIKNHNNFNKKGLF